ncbi:hypothetical protein [Aliagarivorans marinus]|uniref:hypothetical protein n=1 Tax=Aliagarivorans marinus TaxID=561965 RepID=UPI00041DC622|nr:hypothetical protein [Aliagarivorans marinus]
MAKSSKTDKAAKSDKSKSDKPKSDKPKSEKSKKNTSLRLDPATLKALKIRAIEEERSVQKIIESLIKAYLKGKISL